jgi:hypothetical protein
VNSTSPLSRSTKSFGRNGSSSAPSDAPERRRPPASPEPHHAETAQEIDIFAKIERLAELQQKGILSPEEFAAKKAELLSRL